MTWIMWLSCECFKLQRSLKPQAIRPFPAIHFPPMIFPQNPMQGPGLTDPIVGLEWRHVRMPSRRSHHPGDLRAVLVLFWHHETWDFYRVLIRHSWKFKWHTRKTSNFIITSNPKSTYFWRCPAGNQGSTKHICPLVTWIEMRSESNLKLSFIVKAPSPSFSYVSQSRGVRCCFDAGCLKVQSCQVTRIGGVLKVPDTFLRGTY